MVKIYTYAHKRPDFIKIQYQTIIKHIKDADYEYIVFNNAIDDDKLKEQIINKCKSLNIRCIDVEMDDSINQQSGNNYSEKQFNFENNKYKYLNPNVACSYPLIWSFKTIISKEDNENIVVISE